ncbi:MAG: putative lipid II flippase FtsW [Chloroflexia bacterium]
MSALSRDRGAARGGAANRLLAFDTNLRRRPDYWILAAVIGLCLIGLVMVYSASYAAVLSDPKLASNPAAFALRHLQSLLLGCVFLVIFTVVPYPFWRRISVPAMAFTLLLLAFVLFAPASLSPDLNGAHRWLALGISFQPSELCKLVLVLYLADWLSQKGRRVRNLTYGLIPFGIVMGVVAFLVIREPDMGTTIVLLVIGVTIFFIAGAHLIHFLASMVMGGSVFVLLVFAESYRGSRVTAFLHPELDPTGVGYHIIQSQMALGSGGIFGQGLGAGRQKFGWLPEQFTDTIFSVIGQEWGFLGALVLLALFALFIFRGTRTALRARDSYGTLIAVGITAWIGVQALINIGSVSSAIPFTGVTLPFVSFGGSSLAVTMAAVGLLLNISRYSITPRSAPPQPPRRRRFTPLARLRRARPRPTEIEEAGVW